MHQQVRRHLHVRVAIADEAGATEELCFTAHSSGDELLAKLRERCQAEFVGGANPTTTNEQCAPRTEERNGVTFRIVTLPPDPKLRPPTKRQTGRLIAEARLRAGRNRNVPWRCRRQAR